MMRTLLLVVALAGCSKTSEAPTAGAPPAAPAAPAAPARAAKDPETARKWIASGAVVVDVRTPAEYGDGHLPQATNIPIQEFAQRLGDVDKLVAGDKARQVVVYCAAGKRAAKAKEQLEAAGYSQVVNGGGYDDLR
jgi:phage shock protein E